MRHARRRLSAKRCLLDCQDGGQPAPSTWRLSRPSLASVHRSTLRRRPRACLPAHQSLADRSGGWPTEQGPAHLVPARVQRLFSQAGRSGARGVFWGTLCPLPIWFVEHIEKKGPWRRAGHLRRGGDFSWESQLLRMLASAWCERPAASACEKSGVRRSRKKRQLKILWNRR